MDMAQLKGYERTLEETFELVKEKHLKLCKNPRYHKVPFSKRDGVVASAFGVRQMYVSFARRGENYFKRFRAGADDYLRHKDYLPAGKLTEIVDYYFAWLRAQLKYDNESVSSLDAIIARDLGYAQTTIKLARLGRAAGRKLKGCVRSEHRAASYPGARVTYNKVRGAYERLMQDAEFRSSPVLQRDARVAQELHLSRYTVSRAREGSASYKKFGGFYRRPNTQAKYDLVSNAYLKSMRDTAFAGLPAKERDCIIAKKVGLNVHTIIAIRTCSNAYKQFNKFVPVCGPAEQTYDRVRDAYSELMRDTGFSKLTLRRRDEIVAEKLRLSWHTVCAIRSGTSAYKWLNGFNVSDLEKRGVSAPSQASESPASS